jgi:hypothetical protein
MTKHTKATKKSTTTKARKTTPAAPPQTELSAPDPRALLEAIVPASDWSSSPAMTALGYVADEIEAIMDAAETYTDESIPFRTSNLLFRLRERVRAMSSVLPSVVRAAEQSTGGAS